MTFNCQRHHFLKSTWAKIENDDTPKTEVAPPKKGPQKKPNSILSWSLKNKKGNKQKQQVQQIYRYNHKVLPTKNI